MSFLHVPFKRLFRFSLGTLLFAAVCVCGYFGFHRIGRTAGERQRYDEAVFIKTYSLADLMAVQESDADHDRLYEEITVYLMDHISPGSWRGTNHAAMEPGGEVQPFPKNRSLIISHRGAVHRQIEPVLQRFRDERMKPLTERMLQALDQAMATRSATPAVLFSPPQTATMPDGSAAVCFENSVRIASTKWGAPDMHAKCTEHGFPSWSLAHLIAAWEQRGGHVYLAVQAVPDVGEALIAGWHADWLRQ